MNQRISACNSIQPSLIPGKAVMSSKSLCFAEFLKKVLFQRECQVLSPLGRSYSSTYAHHWFAASARVTACLPRGTQSAHLTHRGWPWMFSAWQTTALWSTILFIIIRNRAGENFWICDFPWIIYRDIEQNRVIFKLGNHCFIADSPWTHPPTAGWKTFNSWVTKCAMSLWWCDGCTH